jgi:hypothetical protein
VTSSSQLGMRRIFRNITYTVTSSSYLRMRRIIINSTHGDIFSVVAHAQNHYK